MKKMYKMMLLALCAVLLMAASVMGTLAYLQMTTQTVTNTFTVGKVEITLQEYGIDENGHKTATVLGASSGLSNIKLVPGRKIEKNPFITVTAGSEACFLFVKVKVTENLQGYAAIDWDTNLWKLVTGTTDTYYYAGTYAAGTPVNVFETVTCVDNIDEYTVTSGLTIEVTAYAVQTEGFDDAEDAWVNTFGV